MLDLLIPVIPLIPLVALVRSPHKPIVLPRDDEDDDGAKIRCPACGWRPRKYDLWSCSPGCGHVWNTFETRGICPGCDKHWTETNCIKCNVWSAHDAWYCSDEK